MNDPLTPWVSRSPRYSYTYLYGLMCEVIHLSEQEGWVFAVYDRNVQRMRLIRGPKEQAYGEKEARENCLEQAWLIHLGQEHLLNYLPFSLH